ncbi:MAG: ChaN family lipoprotein, partial [bacterium]
MASGGDRDGAVRGSELNVGVEEREPRVADEVELHGDTRSDKLKLECVMNLQAWLLGSWQLTLVFLGAVLACPPVKADDAPAWEAPPLSHAISIRDGQTGERLALNRMLDELAEADVVFLGETHTDETTHRVELAVYNQLLA